MSLEQGLLVITVPNRFVGGWIEKNFSSQILSALQEVSIADGYKVQVDKAPSTIDEPSRPAPAATGRSSRMAVSPVAAGTKVNDTSASVKRDKYKFSLEKFVTGKSNELAYKASVMAARSEDKIFNPLFIHGTYGTGKTHLLQAICNERLRLNPKAKCVYISAEEFTNKYLDAVLRTKRVDQFRNNFRKVDILAIDDIHFLANKESTKEEFLHTFNSLDLANKQVILASDAHPTQINKLAENLISRFISGMVVRIESPDYDTRVKICRIKLADGGVDITDEAVEYLAGSITKSVRDLEGAVLKLQAYSAIFRKTIDIQTVSHVLCDLVHHRRTVVNVDEIISDSANFFSLSANDLQSNRKDRTASMARSIAMYLSRELTGMSYPEIGKSMGNKHHATVLQACRKVEAKVKKREIFKWKSPKGIHSDSLSGIVDTIRQSVES
ncbi:Chromosomal replication initiator protein DnaA [Limihaloglobus sulfuriphilus]|uniref:Chromosomal replication initiator protein DnaA n=1 Tax=Limihaloglobus sulfuriphilus TaxID=1851148 RepID=A0A1Q2MBQ8_9BACT|nr:Chromosomal replication initiator protein DnaA [Limihaloglobus sulfuriphilus]